MTEQTRSEAGPVAVGVTLSRTQKGVTWRIDVPIPVEPTDSVEETMRRAHLIAVAEYRALEEEFGDLEPEEPRKRTRRVSL